MTRQPTPDIMADVLTSTPVKTLAHADIRQGTRRDAVLFSAGAAATTSSAFSRGSKLRPCTPYPELHHGAFEAYMIRKPLFVTFR